MQTFRSKKDWWILGFIIAATGILLQMLWSMQLRGTLQEYPEHGIVYALVILIMWYCGKYSLYRDSGSCDYS